MIFPGIQPGEPSPVRGRLPMISIKGSRSKLCAFGGGLQRWGSIWPRLPSQREHRQAADTPRLPVRDSDFSSPAPSLHLGTANGEQITEHLGSPALTGQGFQGGVPSCQGCRVSENIGKLRIHRGCQCGIPIFPHLPPRCTLARRTVNRLLNTLEALPLRGSARRILFMVSGAYPFMRTKRRPVFLAAAQ